MANLENQDVRKIKPIKLVEMLTQDSDEENPLTTSMILDKLEKQGIPCDSRVLHRDITMLNRWGFEVMTVYIGHEKAFYMADRKFSVPELKILIDAVQAASFVTDRAYWEKRSTPQMLQIVDKIFEDIGDLISGFELKYNKFYIGIAKDSVARNFVYFQPKKSFIYLIFKGPEDTEKIKKMEDVGLDVNYNRWKQYYVRLESYKQYEDNKELLTEMIASSKSYYNGSDND